VSDPPPSLRDLTAAFSDALRRPLALASVRPALARHASLPAPTAAVPDVATFLTRIGRNCAAHAAKFGAWGTLFDASSAQLKVLGVEPARTRRYILRWRESYRRADGNLALAEHKRGVKKDGGERRRKEVRAKRFAEERRLAEGRERLTAAADGG
jgi:hypothetical protein